MKISENTRKYAAGAAAFLLPGLIMLVVYALMGMAPFGDKSVFAADMSQQYADYYGGLRTALTQGDSLLYTWRSGLGMNYLGIIAYYLASPLNLIVLLFPVRMLSEATLVITLLKLSSCGLAFYIAARSVLKTGHLPSIAFAVLYALCGYSVAYTINPMWLETVILLPIVVLGLHRLVERGRPLCYLFALTATLITCFYTGYMVCAFVVLYFIWLLVSRHEKVSRDMLKPCVRFALSSLAAAGIAAFLLLPTLFALLSSYGDGTVYQFSLDTVEGFWRTPARLLPATYDTLTYSSPSIYSGVVTLILAPAYFFNRVFPRRERLVSAGIVLLLSLSFVYIGLNHAWHVFRQPVWFPHRFAFLFSFFLIWLAARAWEKRTELGSGPLAASVGAGFAILAWGSLTDGGFFGDGIYSNALLLLVLSAALVVCAVRYAKKELVGRILPFALAALVCVEAGYNALGVIAGIDGEFRYDRAAMFYDHIDRVKPAVDWVKANDDSFYRMENWRMRWSDDNMTLGYNGLAHYSSLSNRDTFSFLRENGYLAVTNNRYLRYFGATSLMDSLLGIRYVLGMEGDERRFGYEEIIRVNGMIVYKNTNALPLMYTAGAGLHSYSPPGEDNPFEAQNSLFTALTGIDEPVYIPIPGVAVSGESLVRDYGQNWYAAEKGRLDVTITPEVSGNVLVDFGEAFWEHTPPYINGVRIGRPQDDFLLGVIDLGYFEAGETILFSLDVFQPDAVFRPLVYRMDADGFEHGITRLREGSAYSLEVDGTRVYAEVSAKSDAWLMTSIPYDPGWNARVDGREVDIVKFADAFIVLPLSAGEHTVEFSFIPAGLVPGIVITLVTLAALAAYILIDKRRKRPGE